MEQRRCVVRGGGRTGVVCVALLTACLGGRAAGQVMFQELPIPSSGSVAVPTGMSDDGSTVVGSYFNGDGLLTATRWFDGVRVDVPLLEPGQGFAQEATDVTGDGMLAVGNAQTSLGQRGFGIRLTGSPGMFLLAPPASAGGGGGAAFASYAWGANVDGSVVIGDALWPAFSRAARWRTGFDPQVLQPIAGRTNSWGLDVSDDGELTAGRSDGGTGPSGSSGQTTVWDSAGNVVPVAELEGAVWSTARAISGNGGRVVGETLFVGRSVATTWLLGSAGGFAMEMESLPGGTVATPMAVTFDGTVTVGTAVGMSAQSAVVWSNSLGLVDLNTYLPRFGVNLDGWHLVVAQCVSADGGTVAGVGMRNGVQSAWLARGLVWRCIADVGRQGGLQGGDGLLNNDDFVVFIDLFFRTDPLADNGSQGGLVGPDGQFDNNDFIVFIDQFFLGCP